MPNEQPLPDAGVGADTGIDRAADPSVLDEPDAQAVLAGLQRDEGPAAAAVEDDPAVQEAALDDTTAPHPPEDEGGPPDDGLTPAFSDA